MERKGWMGLGSSLVFSLFLITSSCSHIQKQTSEIKNKEKKNIVLALHRLYPPTPRYRYTSEKLLFYPAEKLKSKLELLINQGFEIKKNKLELGVDDYAPRDYKIFFGLAKYFVEKYPEKCDRDAWSLNVSGMRYSEKTKDIIREFVEWGGDINNHTAHHWFGASLSKKQFIRDYAEGFNRIHNTLSEKIEFEYVKENKYYAYIPRENNESRRYIDAVIPFGSIGKNQIKILREEGVPFKNKMILFKEIQLFDNKIEDGNEENGISRIFFHPYSIRKNKVGDYALKTKNYGRINLKKLKELIR